MSRQGICKSSQTVFRGPTSHKWGLYAILFSACVVVAIVREPANFNPAGIFATSLVLAVVVGFLMFVEYCRTPLASPQDALREYKRVLAGILPAEDLTNEGFLRGREGNAEPIAIQTLLGTVSHHFRGLRQISAPLYPGNAYYCGHLHLKAVRHRLFASRESLPSEEFEQLRTAIDNTLRADGADHDVIDISRCRTKGTLAHEAFHDIQGFLYDNHPVTCEKLQQAVANRKEAITAWFKTHGGKWRSGYSLEQMFPSRLKAVQNLWIEIELLSRLVADESLLSETARKLVVEEACKDLGRLETVPTLLGAAVDGDEQAKSILRDVFAEVGLKTELFENVCVR